LLHLINPNLELIGDYFRDVGRRLHYDRTTRSGRDVLLDQVRDAAPGLVHQQGCDGRPHCLLGIFCSSSSVQLGSLGFEAIFALWISTLLRRVVVPVVAHHQ
jgi:hypothetical protein